MDKYGFVKDVQYLLAKGSSFSSKTVLEKMAKEYGIEDKNLAKELTELTIVQQDRERAHKPGKTVKEKYVSIFELYKGQVNLSHRTSQSVMLQQYSTPAPIGYLMGLFCGVNNPGKFLEPSAGNG